MSLFDNLVEEAVSNLPELAPLRIAVEKELLHHDILREISRAGYLKNLTFIGGTCLRSCYGSQRLSEDLDFTGGANFNREMLSDLGDILIRQLEAKYELPVEVSEPQREEGNTDTWKLRMETRPGKKQLPAQRIHIDICALPSYERKPVMLRQHYGVDMGTSGLILQAQSREEILADKMVALALRPNRLKNRDLWDIVWLHQNGVKLPVDLVLRKATDRQQKLSGFLQHLDRRRQLLQTDPACHRAFLTEMRRFLPPAVIKETLEEAGYWAFLVDVVTVACQQVQDAAQSV